MYMYIYILLRFGPPKRGHFSRSGPPKRGHFSTILAGFYICVCVCICTCIYIYYYVSAPRNEVIFLVPAPRNEVIFLPFWRGFTYAFAFFLLDFFFSLVVKPENHYFASRLGFEVKSLGVYPLGPRSSSCGPTKGTPPPRTTLRANSGQHPTS